MGESLPFALRAMASAAAEAGLIDGTMSQQKQEAALRKLMENGKAIASEILPHFGKELQKLARANNGLAKALEDNFNPSLMRAKNTLTELMNTMWENGMKQAFTSITDSFTVLGQEAGSLAKTLSSFLGGAIMGLTFPIKLLLAGIGDLVSFMKDLFGITDETADGFLTFTAKAAGVAAGLLGLFKIVKMLVGGVSAIAKGFGLLSNSAKGASAAVGGVATAASGALAVFSKLFGVVTALMTVWDARAGGDLSATSLFGDNEITRFLDKPISEHFASSSNQTAPKQQIEVKVGVDGNGNITPYIMSKIDEAQEQQLIDFYQNISPMN
tara:strand:- start:41334 stop:42314 length:981 start_codon:yes stop_codon:yes gene_type:complete